MSGKDSLDREFLKDVIMPYTTIRDIVTGDSKRIEYSFEEEAFGNIALVAKIREYVSEKKVFSSTQFEDVLRRVLTTIKNDNPEMRIEKDEVIAYEISNLDYNLIDRLNNTSLSFYMKKNQVSHMTNGIGIVSNIDTKDEVAIFENVEFRTTDMLKSFIGNLSTNDLEELRNNKYLFTFYSLDNQKKYEMKDFSSSEILNHNHGNVCLVQPDVRVEEFTELDIKYNLVKEQFGYKSFIKGLDRNNPVNESVFDNFRKKRLEVVREFKDKMRKEEIIQEFSDIDI